MTAALDEDFACGAEPPMGRRQGAYVGSQYRRLCPNCRIADRMIDSNPSDQPAACGRQVCCGIRQSWAGVMVTMPSADDGQRGRAPAAPDLLLYPVFDEAEAFAGMPTAK
jgi:hypothetical protein